MNDRDSSAFATHDSPVWRDRANYILQADLSAHGMPGRFEQLWARDLGHGRYELCCLPFFTYGYALGDIVVTRGGVDTDPVVGDVVEPSDHRLLRVALVPPAERHEELHAAVARSGRPHEWRGSGGLVSIDVDRQVPKALLATIERLAATGDLEWEWGHTTPPSA